MSRYKVNLVFVVVNFINLTDMITFGTMVA